MICNDNAHEKCWEKQLMLNLCMSFYPLLKGGFFYKIYLKTKAETLKFKLDLSIRLILWLSEMSKPHRH